MQKSIEKNKINFIDFLREITEIVSTETYQNSIVNKLNKTFSEFLPVSKVEIYVWDNTVLGLKNFEGSWSSNQKKYVSEVLNIMFADLSSSKKNYFCVNDNFVSLENEQRLADITEIYFEEDETNSLYFPLSFCNEVFGLIEIKLKKHKNNPFKDENFIKILDIAIKEISAALLNQTLKEQMDVSLNFYSAMKDIAKIIESQYELSYIIPIIGEMIDRFIPAHLIYIFILNKDKEFELIWPNACKDKEVYKLLSDLKKQSMNEYVLSDDRHVGVFPLRSDEGLMGAIVAFSNIDELAMRDVDYLVQLSQQSSTTIQRANVYAEVLKHATLDALTGLNNRRQFEIRLNQEIATTKRKNTPLCCMMLDVDYFKKVNDTYGHTAGDNVLKAVAQLITDEIREYDIPCRYGGEEFFVILPQTTLEEASLVAQRLRKTIENYKIRISSNESKREQIIRITISIGVSNYRENLSFEDFCKNVDGALYEAKNNGRNRVIVYKN